MAPRSHPALIEIFQAGQSLRSSQWRDDRIEIEGRDDGMLIETVLKSLNPKFYSVKLFYGRFELKSALHITDHQHFKLQISGSRFFLNSARSIV